MGLDSKSPVGLLVPEISVGLAIIRRASTLHHYGMRIINGFGRRAVHERWSARMAFALALAAPPKSTTGA